MVNDKDREHLRLAVTLAREALDAGDAPFGSVLVSEGKVIQTDRNRTVTGADGDNRADATLHPEFTLAHWAQLNLTAPERAKTTVYTSGEHCAMCSAAHAWCGLGRIVYVSSTEQYGAWKDEFGVDQGPVSPLSIRQVVPGIEVEGPVEGLDEDVRALHVERWTAQGFKSSKA
ncbi:cytosine deaminase [Fusarium albosuccineum]|uniref:Cytosine deaminase n=1 Tax=Fusarium albosuccineum TaxID=1237068 RepID=A0A8H4LBX0_9HYPO|nr:cytosine deaminase [Fusarium albosuccineum]